MVKHREWFGISALCDSRRDILLRGMILSGTFRNTTVETFPLANNAEHSPTVYM